MILISVKTFPKMLFTILYESFFSVANFPKILFCMPSDIIIFTLGYTYFNFRKDILFGHKNPNLPFGLYLEQNDKNRQKMSQSLISGFIGGLATVALYYRFAKL